MTTQFKKLAISFDDFIEQAGIGAALFFVLIELISVNTQSLFYVFGKENWYNIIWAMLGAMGYSIVTTVIIRKNVDRWLKLSFPVFDVFLVFIGMNIDNWVTILDNPLRFAVTIFFSLFTGATIMALGLINYSEHFRNIEIEKLTSQLSSLKSDLLEMELENDRLTNDLDDYQRSFKELEGDYLVSLENKEEMERQLEVTSSMLDEYKTKYLNIKNDLAKIIIEVNECKHQYKDGLADIKQYETDAIELKGQLDKKTSEILLLKEKLSEFDSYKSVYISSERSRILKKKAENRTPDENYLLIKTHRNE